MWQPWLVVVVGGGDFLLPGEHARFKVAAQSLKQSRRLWVWGDQGSSVGGWMEGRERRPRSCRRGGGE